MIISRCISGLKGLVADVANKNSPKESEESKIEQFSSSKYGSKIRFCQNEANDGHFRHNGHHYPDCGMVTYGLKESEENTIKPFSSSKHSAEIRHNGHQSVSLL